VKAGLHSFTGASRVTVVDPESPLLGRSGAVRRGNGDGSAWVRMDEALPDELRRFPVDDPHGRGRDMRLYPQQCKRAGGAR
jgi:hypothetical protein